MAEATFIDTAVVIIIVGAGIAILYKALKEPLDLLFGFIWRGLVSIKEKIAGAGESSGYEEITYG